MHKQTIFSLVVLLLFILTTKVGALQRGRMVGGRTQVKDVKTNKEVQQLGKFSVEEYNKEVLGKLPSPSPIRSVSNGSLDFVEVVDAQRQVVSGIKYYLKVETVEGGVRRTFDAVVVVKPWVHESKQLLNFSPSKKPKYSDIPTEQM